MGDLRPDNGWPADDGSQRGLPGLPPEWGEVVIPDDPSELADEAATLRRELRRHAWRNRARRLVGLPPVSRMHREEAPGVLIPLMIMALAIVTTLISLFLMTGRQPIQPPPITGTAQSDGSAATANGQATPLADLTLNDASGHPIRLGSMLPGVILLVNGCSCNDLILQTSATVGADGSVIAVGDSAPVLPTVPPNAHALADPAGILRAQYAAGTQPASDSATAIVVDSTGHVASVTPTVRDLIQLREPLRALTP